MRCVQFNVLQRPHIGTHSATISATPSTWRANVCFLRRSSSQKNTSWWDTNYLQQHIFHNTLVPHYQHIIWCYRQAIDISGYVIMHGIEEAVVVYLSQYYTWKDWVKTRTCVCAQLALSSSSGSIIDLRLLSSKEKTLIILSYGLAY